MTDQPRVACVMMQRNEDVCLRPWLIWHGHLFGYGNLVVVDHGSEDEAVMAVLAEFETRGVFVLRLPASADFKLKGEYIVEIMQGLQRTGRYDFLLPLDCDEFLVMRDAQGLPDCNRDNLLNYIALLRGDIFGIRENFLNILGHRDVFFALPYEGLLFRAGAVRRMDEGLHRCLDGTPAIPTSLVFVHYHHKTFARHKRMSLEKLKHYVDVTDRTALEAFRGVGHHLVANVLGSKADYMSIMRPDDRCIEFAPLNAEFERLGIDPGFYEAP